jgi:hypothetical protein
MQGEPLTAPSLYVWNDLAAVGRARLRNVNARYLEDLQQRCAKVVAESPRSGVTKKEDMLI